VLVDTPAEGEDGEVNITIVVPDKVPAAVGADAEATEPEPEADAGETPEPA